MSVFGVVAVLDLVLETDVFDSNVLTDVVDAFPVKGKFVVVFVTDVLDLIVVIDVSTIVTDVCDVIIVIDLVLVKYLLNMFLVNDLLLI